MSRGRKPAAALVAAIAVLIVLGGCGDDGDSEDDSGRDAAHSEPSYVNRANAICRQGVREAKRIGRSASNVDPGDIDTITAIFVKPGISLLERQAGRLRRLDAPPEDEAFDTYVGLYDPAIVLVRERVRAAVAGKPAEVQTLAESMDQLSVDSRVAARTAGLDDCDVDIARVIVLAAAGK